MNPGSLETTAPASLGEASFMRRWVAVFGTAAAVGCLIVLGPDVLLITVALLLAILVIAVGARKKMLGLLLFGALLMGLYGGSRDFSYLGLTLGPMTLYVSEIILAATAVMVAPTALRRLRGGDRSAFPAALLIYLGIGVIALCRGLPAYGIEALRDSALSYYALAFSLTILLTPTARRLWLLLVLSACGWLIAGAVVYSNYLMGIGVALDANGLERYGAGGQAIACVGSVGAAIASWAPGVSRRARLSFGALALVNLFIGVLFIQHRSLSIGILLVILILMRVCLAERSLPVTVVVAAMLMLLILPLLLNAGLRVVPSMLADTLGRLKSMTSGSEDANIDWRITVWQQTFAGAIAHPIMGTGYGPPISADLGYRIDYDIDPHNSYLAILYRLGVPGLIAFLLFWAPIVKRAYVKACAVPDSRFLIGAALGVHLGIVVLAFFNVVLEGPYMGIPFWVSLGLVHQASTIVEGGASI